MKLTDGQSADLVIETGGGDTFARSLNAAAFGGTVCAIGFLSGYKPTIDVMPIFFKRLNIRGNNTGLISDFRDAVRGVAGARIRPAIDRTFEFDDAPSAYKELASGWYFGKLAIRVDG